MQAADFTNLSFEAPAPRQAPPKPFTYSVIPLLQELLPRHGGQPGTLYLQVAIEHQKIAQDKGFTMISGSKFYTIVGPNGSVDCALYGHGEPIKGADPSASIRRCIVDSKLEWATGLLVRDDVLLEVYHLVRPPALPEPQAPPQSKPRSSNGGGGLASNTTIQRPSDIAGQES